MLCGNTHFRDPAFHALHACGNAGVETGDSGIDSQAAADDEVAAAIALDDAAVERCGHTDEVDSNAEGSSSSFSARVSIQSTLGGAEL